MTTKASGSVASMTGFAHVEGTYEGISWTVEIRSVNNRGLDMRLRLPNGYDTLEPVARGLISGNIKRGSIQLALSLSQTERGSNWRINREVLDQVMSLAKDLEAAGAGPQRLDAVLSVRGVLENVDETEATDESDRLKDAIKADIEKAVTALVEARQAEGKAMEAVIRGQLQTIEDLVNGARGLAGRSPETLRERLHTMMAELLSDDSRVSAERVEQEIALLMVKGDVQEELDRLEAHIAAACELLDNGQAIGRKLDFLCQEFNREANTLCSKAASVELGRIGLDLKAVIDQMREQVQNIE